MAYEFQPSKGDHEPSILTHGEKKLSLRSSADFHEAITHLDNESQLMEEGYNDCWKKHRSNIGFYVGCMTAIPLCVWRKNYVYLFFMTTTGLAYDLGSQYVSCASQRESLMNLNMTLKKLNLYHEKKELQRELNILDRQTQKEQDFGVPMREKRHKDGSISVIRFQEEKEAL